MHCIYIDICVCIHISIYIYTQIYTFQGKIYTYYDPRDIVRGVGPCRDGSVS